MAVGKGDGTTITHSGILFVVETITLDGREIPEIGTADLTATSRTWEAGNVEEFGTLVCDVEWDPAQALPALGGAASNLVLDPQGAGTPHVYTASAFLRATSTVIPLGNKMTGTLTFRLTSAWDKA